MDGGTAIIEIPYLALTKHFLRSEMLDLTRFPVSDGAGIKCYTFCTILDRKLFLDFFSFHFSEKCELFGSFMEMSGIGC